MDRTTLYRLTGSMQQLAYTRLLTVEEGRAGGMRAVEVKNDDLRFLIMADKGLDVAALEYQGMTLSFTSKPGLNGRNPFDTHGQEALRSIMGGLFFTCGLQNICGPCKTGDEEYPMHGRIRTTPAEHVCADACWEGDDYVLTVRGELRESHLFGPNLVLRRTIRSVFGSGRLEIIDEVENQTPEEADLMLMYHCNFGYPFLRPGTRLILPSKAVRGREDWSQAHLDCWEQMQPPLDGEEEYVFLHELGEDAQGRSFAALVSDELGFGVRLDFDRRVQPYFMQWVSRRSGDYVIGLEPSNSSVYGRKYHEKEGTLHRIAPFGKETYHLSFTILKDAAAIAETQKQAEALKGEEK